MSDFVGCGLYPSNRYLRSTPHPVTVTTRIITFLVGNPYKPSFATVTGWGVDPTDTFFLDLFFCGFAYKALSGAMIHISDYVCVPSTIMNLGNL